MCQFYNNFVLIPHFTSISSNFTSIISFPLIMKTYASKFCFDCYCIFSIVVFYVSYLGVSRSGQKCLQMFQSVLILIFGLNSINGWYFLFWGILDAIICVTEGPNSLGILCIVRLHIYPTLLPYPKMIPSCLQLCIVSWVQVIYL